MRSIYILFTIYFTLVSFVAKPENFYKQNIEPVAISPKNNTDKDAKCGDCCCMCVCQSIAGWVFIKTTFAFFVTPSTKTKAVNFYTPLLSEGISNSPWNPPKMTNTFYS